MSENDEMWVRVADALYFIENTEAVAQIARKFEGEYLPAITKATTDEARERAVGALDHYLRAGATPRKPWSLKPEQSAQALEALLTLV